MWRYYSIAVHEGASAEELVIGMYARTLKDAVEAVQRWGYTLAAPPGYELVKKG
jgi:hypothetical protein